MSDWWDDIEREMERLAADAPDPWADNDGSGSAPALTDDQVAFLEQMRGHHEQVVEADDWLDPPS
jgi:hypothetical protein